jgi:hypothetical protein
MDQRPVRLGDILDDYCPRERRVTNHAVVAMIEEDVKQTRCTTCDAEHAYKGARVPRRKPKETAAVLYKEVLAAMPEGELAAPHAGVEAMAGSDEPSAAEPPAETLEAATARDEESPEADRADEGDDIEETSERMPDVEDGPVHRPLIRATLPRPEGQKDARPAPEFTIRQTGGHGAHTPFRGGDSRAKARRGGPHGANGNRQHGGQRFAGSRQPGQGRAGQGRGAVPGFRSGPPRHKKRSR